MRACVCVCGTAHQVRVIAEVVTAHVHQYFAGKGVRPETVARAYRAGYTPETRRAIEADLFSGALRGVIATNALELGVDIGALDAVVHLGFPGSVSSLFQQAGRAGRRGQESLSVLVVGADPLDQHFAKCPEDLYAAAAGEEVVTDPMNRVLLEQHLRCAAYELEVRPSEDSAYFGPDIDAAAATSRLLRQAPDPRSVHAPALWTYPYADAPHPAVNIRTIEEDHFIVADYGACDAGGDGGVDMRVLHAPAALGGIAGGGLRGRDACVDPERARIVRRCAVRSPSAMATSHARRTGGDGGEPRDLYAVRRRTLPPPGRILLGARTALSRADRARGTAVRAVLDAPARLHRRPDHTPSPGVQHRCEHGHLW